MTEMLVPPEFVFLGQLRGPADEVDALGDYSSAPAHWSIIHDDPLFETHYLVIRSIRIVMAFTGKTDVRYYGPIAAPGLANGLRLEFVKAGTPVDVTNRAVIRNHLDLIGIGSGGGSIQAETESPGKNDEGYISMAVGPNAAGRGVYMESGDALRMALNDDFSAGGKMTAHRFYAVGFYVDRDSVVPAKGAAAYAR